MKAINSRNVILKNAFRLKAFILLVLVLAVFYIIYNNANPPIPPQPGIYSMSPGVQEIQFAAAPCEPNGNEKIGNEFISSETTCIYFRFDQDRTNNRNPYDYLLHLELYKDTGEIFMDFSKEQHIEPVWPEFSTSLRVGIDEPGYWPPGKYFAYVSIDGKLYAQGSYEITAPQ